MVSPATVLRSLADWQAYYETWDSPSNVPAPPVDFTSQMLIVYGVNTSCDMTVYSVSSVCEGPDQVTISVTVTDSITCYECYAISHTYLPLAVAVPQSNLPVVMDTTFVWPCGPPGSATATPTPTTTP